MRLIDADALIKKAGRLWEEMPDGEELSKELMKVINHAPTIGGLIRVNECSSCRYWDSKSGLSARMCEQFNGFTTQHEFCSRWKPKEEE